MQNKLVLFISLMLFAACGSQEGDPRVKQTLPATGNSATPGSLLRNPMLGLKRILVLRLSYPDDSGPSLAPLTDGQTLDWERAFSDNSYGLAQFKFKVFDLMMPQPASFYTVKYAGPALLRADAFKLLEQRGINPRAYDGELILSKKVWLQHPGNFGGWNARTAYISTGSPEVYKVVHEFGHAMGLHHANLWYVGSGSPIASGGRSLEYFDFYDPMGGINFQATASGYKHFNPWYKLQLGWLTEADVPTISASGTYVIENLDDPNLTTGVRALRIRKNADTDYYVFRRGNNPPAAGGVMISFAGHRNLSNSNLIDMTPGSRPGAEDWRDAMLLPNESLYDPEPGVRIKLLSVTPTQATVRVDFDPGANPQAIDNLPVIDIPQPTGMRTIAGTMLVRATAYDPDVGTYDGAGIKKLDVLLIQMREPQKLVTSFTRRAPGMTYHLNVGDLPPGPYSVVAIATDLQDRTHLTRRVVIVDNAGPSF